MASTGEPAGTYWPNPPAVPIVAVLLLGAGPVRIGVQAAWFKRW